MFHLRAARPRRALALGISALLTVLALAACTKTFDTGSVQTAIKNDLQQKGFIVSSVKCPNNVEVKVGNTFNCTVDFTHAGSSQTSGSLTATVTDTNGGFRINSDQLLGGSSSTGTPATPSTPATTTT